MTRKIAQGLIAGMRQSVRPEVLKLRDFVHGRPAARKLMAEVKSIESLVAGGSQPSRQSEFCSSVHSSGCCSGRPTCAGQDARGSESLPEPLRAAISAIPARRRPTTEGF